MTASPLQFAPSASSQVEALEQRVRELERLVLGANPSARPNDSEPALATSVRTLRELFEYAVLRPIDMVKLDGDPYFCYVRDLVYTLFAEEKPDTFVRNYALTAEDLRPPAPFDFSIKEFMDTRRRSLPRDEHYAKLVTFAHLWLHDVDFTLLDIGANIGYSAVPCAKFMRRFGRSNPIHSFEPGLAADLLASNLELNRVSDLVTPHRLALSDRSGPVAFNSMLGHSVCDRITDFRQHYPHLVPAISRVLSAVTIDDFVKQHNITNTLVLKIDAEGHDLQVLRGARECFERGQVGVTIVEFVPDYLKAFIDPGQMLVDLSREHHLLHILEFRKGHHWQGAAIPQDDASLRRFAREVAASPLRYTDVIAIARRLPGAERLHQCLCEPA